MSNCQQTALTMLFLFLLSSTYFIVLQRVSNGYFKEHYYFLRFQKGSNFFKGDPTFSAVEGGGGGVKMLISIETHITCDFPGGSGPPIPPLDSHMQFHYFFFLFQKKRLAVASQKIPLKKSIHLRTKTNVWTY